MAVLPPGADSTAPGAPNSTVGQLPAALHFVYPRELEGLVIPLTHGLELGRGVGEDLPRERWAQIAHATVSRRHAAIQYGFERWVLTDLGSANGTRLGGRDLDRPRALELDGVVRFGDTIAVVDTHEQQSVEDASTLWGHSPRIAMVRKVLMRAAAEPVPVLIQGETGTGKEFLAADVHRLSNRRGPYVKVNCAELAPQLIESQLFGHERGAFTGAMASHAGLLVAADQGTLFLDEIGELSLDLQAKLLRVIQEGEVRPVGSIHTRKVDVRIVCATNRNLAADVEAGRFRRDLYARLSFFELHLPPLRERRLDILRWLDRFCQRWGTERGRSGGIQLQPAVAERLLLHSWPENLRGLDRFAHRVLSVERPAQQQASVGLRALFEALPEILSDSLGTPPTSESTDPPAADAAPDAAGGSDVARPGPSGRPSREEFLAVYEATGRSVRATSKYFARDRRQVYRWLEIFGIER
jgi:transcriptional regulator with GAF, ATPase, and Fis domain